MDWLSVNQKPESFQPIIGLEVHIELKTQSKMFCSCPAAHFGTKPNTQTCPICLGLPGSLPYPNQKAIESALLVGLALNCQINRFSKFDRKNYFYPDLPKGYQISQYDLPLAITGNWKLETGNLIRIRRVHLEEDTAKLIHQFGSQKSKVKSQNYSLVDFNRAGVPLMEIVTEPDFHSSEAVRFFLQKLQQLVRYLRVAEADMEKGQMRCEPNVNLKIIQGGRTYFTPIVEIKNINSFRFVKKAIEYEIKRQLAEFQKTRGGKTSGNKSTRGWDEKKQMTVLQRVKEEAQDYRYFPEPDIPPMRWTKSQITNLKSQIPELPDKKLERFIRDYGLSESNTQILIETRQKADYFEQVVKIGKTQGLGARQIANLIVNKRLDWLKLSPQDFVQKAGEKIREVLMPMEEVSPIVEQIIKENPQAVRDYLKGKLTVIEFLVGQVVRLSRGKADLGKARRLLKKRLKTT